MNPKIEKMLTKIAKDHLQMETLETRKSDSLDFKEVSVWSVKDALSAAFEAGATYNFGGSREKQN
jgi:hypothetical protein